MARYHLYACLDETYFEYWHLTRNCAAEDTTLGRIACGISGYSLQSRAHRASADGHRQWQVGTGHGRTAMSLGSSTAALPPHTPYCTRHVPTRMAADPRVCRHGRCASVTLGGARLREYASTAWHGCLPTCQPLIS
jgi:hypothetical protein